MKLAETLRAVIERIGSVKRHYSDASIVPDDLNGFASARRYVGIGDCDCAPLRKTYAPGTRAA
jgi:hypothetical protein